MSEPLTEATSTSAIRVVISLLILGGGIGGFFAMGTPKIETRLPQRAQSAIVETTAAVRHDDGIEFVVDGVVVPFQQIQIAAEVGGRVAHKSPQCRTGKSVRKGDLLIRIDPKDYELEVRRLDEELVQADAMIRELQSEIDTIDNQIGSAKKQVDLDDRQLSRTIELFDRRAASETELDTAKRTALGSRSNLQTLQDQKSQINQRRIRLQSAKALGETNLEKSNLALSRTEIRSPIDGIVVSENVEQGGYVQTGNPVIVLQDNSQLDVTCQLRMEQMHWLWQAGNQSGAVPNQASPADSDVFDLNTDAINAQSFPATGAEVLYDLGGRTYVWNGLIDRLDGTGIDNQTRMVPCRVHVQNPNSGKSESTDDNAATVLQPPALMTGMFVKVRIRAVPPIALVRLPQQAVQPGNVIWVVDQGKLQRKVIEVASSDVEQIVAYQRDDGVQAGDQIVVSPLATPIEGVEVTLLADFEEQKATRDTTAVKRQGDAS